MVSTFGVCQGKFKVSQYRCILDDPVAYVVEPGLFCHQLHIKKLNATIRLRFLMIMLVIRVSYVINVFLNVLCDADCRPCAIKLRC